MTSGGAGGWSSFSGRQVEIRLGGQRAVVVEVGGGLREYDVDGQAVLDGYPINSTADGGRALPLMPWPNRLADGQYEFQGKHLQLAIDDVVRRNAMHGLTRTMNWIVGDRAADRVRMELTLHPRQGYPFALELSIEYSLAPTGLTARTTARNLGDTPLPFGAGVHPYFTVGTPLVDSATLAFDARSRLELDSERRLPTGELLTVAGSAFDFSAPRLIGSLVLDDCFSGLARDADGRARVTLSDQVSGRSVSVWMDAGYRYMQIFSGDTLAPARRRQSLAIEPMTCPPNAFRTGTDLIVLDPGQACSLEYGFTPAVITNERAR
jgi:aldose 1-epimerase